MFLARFKGEKLTSLMGGGTSCVFVKSMLHILNDLSSIGISWEKSGNYFPIQPHNSKADLARPTHLSFGTSCAAVTIKIKQTESMLFDFARMLVKKLENRPLAFPVTLGVVANRDWSLARCKKTTGKVIAVRQALIFALVGKNNQHRRTRVVHFQ